MTLKEVKEFIVENNIHIPSECWKLFMQFLGTQLMSISNVCIDSKVTNTETVRQVTECMKKHIPQFDKLALMINELNQYKHGVFNKPIYKLYLVLAYIAIAYDDEEKLTSVLLSFACFMLSVEFKQRFRICNQEYMQLAMTYMSSKAVYRKFELNHVEVVKYIVTDVLKRYPRNTDDFVFRMLRLILARITQNLNTLARAYYAVAQKAKQSHSIGQVTSTVSTTTLIQTMALHFDTAKSIISQQSIRQKLKIKLNDDATECLLNHLDYDLIRRIFLYIMNTNENFRKRVTSHETCNQLKTLFNMIYAQLSYIKEYDEFFLKVQKACPTITPINNGDVKKTIAFLIVLLWKMSVCGG